MSENNTKKFAFVLGREIELALAELKAVLDRFGFYFDIYSITENIAFANIDDFAESDAKKVVDALGGTTKIFQILDSRSNKLDTQIAEAINDNKATESKLNFGISWYSRNRATDLFRFGLGIKKLLKAKGLSVRLVESKESELSTILSTKNNLDQEGIEIGIFDSTIGILRAVTNPYEWSKRDYDKPRADKKSGMVPPKLARMMINLALSGNGQQSAVGSQQGTANCKLQTANYLVVDPFCGSGNILMEAVMLGCNVFGSDVSPKAVDDTKANIEWLMGQITNNQETITRKNPNLKFQLPKSEIVQADATKAEFLEKFTAYRLPLTADKQFVVAEPFLGEPKKFVPSLNAAQGEYQKVKEIYLNFFANISALAPKLSALAIVFPLVETIEGKRYSLWDESVDEIRNLGYTQIRSFIYGRDYQIVKREIVILKFQDTRNNNQ